MDCIPFGSWATFGRYRCVDCDFIYELTSDRILPTCPNINKSIHTMNCWKEVFFTPKEEERVFEKSYLNNKELIEDLVAGHVKGRTNLRKLQPEKGYVTVLQHRLAIKGTDRIKGCTSFIYLQGEHIETGDTIVWDSDKRSNEIWKVIETDERDDLIICKVKRHKDIGKGIQKAAKNFDELKGKKFGEYSE